MAPARRGSGGNRQEFVRRQRRGPRPAREPGGQALELQSFQSAADGKPGAARDESLTRMDLATYKTDVWGREVILGASWDLLWLVAVVSFIVIALHAVVVAVRRRAARPSSSGPRVARHKGVDRIFHWVMAVSVLVLLVTGIFPIIGLEFSWLTVHWIAGLVLTAAVLFHIIRSLFWQDLKSMWISGKDLKEPFDATLKPGKYSVAQKGMHAAVTVLVLLVIASGLVMFAMIDTPWWD